MLILKISIITNYPPGGCMIGPDLADKKRVNNLWRHQAKIWILRFRLRVLLCFADVICLREVYSQYLLDRFLYFTGIHWLGIKGRCAQLHCLPVAIIRSL